MGSGASSELTYDECIAKFCSSQPISDDCDFWNTFLSMPQKQYFKTSFEGPQLKEMYNLLMANNKSSANLPALIKQCIQRLEYRPLNSGVLKEAENGLYILRIFLKLMVENITEAAFLAHCNLRRGDRSGPSEADPLECFLGSLIRFLAAVPVAEHYQGVHVECVSCLIVLLAIQLYSDQTPNSFYVYRCIMQGREADAAPAVTEALLNCFIKTALTMNSTDSLVVSLTDNFVNIVIPRETTEMAIDSLSNLSAWLLLIFTYYCMNDRSVANPYLRPMFTFTNTESQPAVKLSVPTIEEDLPAPVHALSMDLSALYKALCATLDQEGSTLLLYTLLHKNPNVRTYLMARTDIELMIVPILKNLYTAGSQGSYHHYMSLVIILIFSEDDLFSKTVHHIKLKNITWFSERSIREISLGGLLVLVLLRTVQMNIMTMRDKYLHSNCLASLANMSCHFTELHPYVCQRLIDLFEVLLKKYERLHNELHPSRHKTSDASTPAISDALPLPSPSGTSSPASQPDVIKIHQCAVLEEGLRTIAQTISVALRHNVRGNPNLVYAVLHKKIVFDRARKLPGFMEGTETLYQVIAHFTAVLDRISGDPTEETITAAITEGSLRLHFPQFSSPDLKFQYIEGEEAPETFFLPYIWSVIQSQSHIHFDGTHVRMRLTD